MISDLSNYGLVLSVLPEDLRRLFSTYNKWELWWQLSDGLLLYEFLRVKEKRVTYSNKVSVSLFRERLDSSTGDF